MRRELDHLRWALIKVEPGACRGEARELHRFRVVVRWARSLLSDLADALPDAGVEIFASELRWLGRLTSPSRDLDVQIRALHQAAGSFSAPEQKALGPVLAILEERRGDERTKVRRGFESKRLGCLLDRWQALAEGTERAPSGTLGARHVGTQARLCLGKALKRASKRGERALKDEKASSVHRFRIAGKRWRYLVQSFGPLYSTREIEPLMRDLKRLQETLGDYHDAACHIRLLRPLATRLEGADSTTFVALGRLEEQAVSARQAALTTARPLFRSLTDEGPLVHLKRLALASPLQYSVAG